MNTYPSLHPIPSFHFYYVAYLKTDPAKEPIAVEQSTARLLADASAKLGRPKSDFEIIEISKERYEILKKFLAAS